MKVRVRYFASLREQARVDEEVVETSAPDLKALYAELQQRHGFRWPVAHLRVALDGDFADWGTAPGEGGDVAFIPPVSGG